MGEHRNVGRESEMRKATYVLIIKMRQTLVLFSEPHLFPLLPQVGRGEGEAEINIERRWGGVWRVAVECSFWK